VGNPGKERRRPSITLASDAECSGQHGAAPSAVMAVFMAGQASAGQSAGRAGPGVPLHYALFAQIRGSETRRQLLRRPAVTQSGRSQLAAWAARSGSSALKACRPSRRRFRGRPRLDERVVGERSVRSRWSGVRVGPRGRCLRASSSGSRSGTLLKPPPPTNRAQQARPGQSRTLTASSNSARGTSRETLCPPIGASQTARSARWATRWVHGGLAN